MKSAFLFAVLAISSLAVAEPATGPSTTGPAVETLLKGDLVFIPPGGWKMEGRTSDDRRVGYSSGDPKAVMVVNVDPQTDVISESSAPRFAQQIIKNITDNAAKNGLEITLKPKNESDERFFLHIHHRYKTKGEPADQMQAYRVLGRNLVAVATTVFTDSPDEAKRVFDEAEKTLLSIKPAKEATAARTGPKPRPASRPTALPAAKISFSAPFGWKEELNDKPSGIVATYHDPAENFNMIIITVRPLPAEAKKDPKLRDAVVEEMVRGEKTQFKFDGAQPVGEAEVVKDRRFLRKERIRYERSDAKIQVTARQLRIGDAVVSVAMASLEISAADVDKLADDVAMTLKPMR